MTLIGMVVFLVIFAVVAYVSYWVITKFFPEPAKTPALAVVGILLLLALLSQLFPEVGGMRICK